MHWSSWSSPCLRLYSSIGLHHGHHVQCENRLPRNKNARCTFCFNYVACKKLGTLWTMSTFRCLQSMQVAGKAVAELHHPVPVTKTMRICGVECITRTICPSTWNASVNEYEHRILLHHWCLNHTSDLCKASSLTHSYSHFLSTVTMPTQYIATAFTSMHYAWCMHDLSILIW
jgi:hypothetical protein